MLVRGIRILLWISSVVAIVGFVALTVNLMPASTPAAAAERVLLEHADRLAAGAPLYRAAGGSFAVPVMPGMPWLLSALGTLFGSGLILARLVTLTCTLGVAALALLIVRAETRSGLMGTVSAGLLLAGFAAFALRTSAASCEPLALLLGIGAMATLRFGTGLFSVLGSALLVTASYYVHPIGAGFFAAGVAYLVLHHPKHALLFTLTAGLVGGGAYVWFSKTLGIWFNFNAWEGPISLMQFRPLHLLHAVGDELLGRLGVLTFSSVLAFALPARPWRGPTGLWMWCAFVAVGFGLLATQNARISPTELLPAIAGLAILGPISAQRVTQHLAAWPGSSRLGGQTVVLASLVLQFVMMLAGVTAAILPPAA